MTASDWIESAGLVVSFAGSLWLVKAFYRRGPTEAEVLDAGDASRLITDLRNDAVPGSLVLAIGFLAQLAAKLFR